MLPVGYRIPTFAGIKLLDQQKLVSGPSVESYHYARLGMRMKPRRALYSHNPYAKNSPNKGSMRIPLLFLGEHEPMMDINCLILTRYPQWSS